MMSEYPQSLKISPREPSKTNFAPRCLQTPQYP